MKFLQPFTKKSVTQNNVLSGYLMISFLYFFASHIVIVIKINILIKTAKKKTEKNPYTDKYTYTHKAEIRVTAKSPRYVFKL